MNKNLKNQLVNNFKESKLVRLYEAEVSNINEDYFEMKVLPKDFMIRPAGMFNGAAIATLVDISSYASALTKSSSGYYATVDLKINYLSPAFGEVLIAKSSVVKRGKLLTTVRSDIFTIKNNVEKLVATSLVTLIQLKNDKESYQIC